MNHPKLNSEWIKAEALRLGFSACGIAPVLPVNETHTRYFRQWLSEGKQAGMSYMANHEEKRLDPRLLLDELPGEKSPIRQKQANWEEQANSLENGKNSQKKEANGQENQEQRTSSCSMICVALNYYPSRMLSDDQYQFAWYAYGKDYHDVMKSKLTQLQAYIDALSPLPLRSRIFCDTAPVLERYWAEQAGLGWIGKNTQLILPQAGSCFFLGEILIAAQTDEYDQPQANRCGHCTRCLQACPTNALEASYRLNAEKCLSYLTIEHRGAFPPDTRLKTSNKIYGCDDCQKACPWNRLATPCHTPELQPSEAFMKMKREDWKNLTEEQYKGLFKGSAVKRAKYEGLMRNLEQLTIDN